MKGVFMGAANGHLLNDVVIAVYDSLFRYWKGRGFRSAEAEDLAQEGLCKAIQSAGAWERKAKLKTFLISVGKNRGIDYLRKEGTQSRLKDAASDAVSLVCRKSQRRTPKAKSQ
jgi:DNA-directed RNA polymerase specialized sigma24 family protein